MNRSILKKYLTSKWIWLLLIELVVIGSLVYQFIPHKPIWGAVPQEIATVNLRPVAGGPVESIALPQLDYMYVNAKIRHTLVFKETEIIATFPPVN